MYDVVAQRLRLFLAKKNITYRKLSGMIFMSETTLNGKLNGTRTLDLNTLISITTRLEDVSVEWLLRGEGDMFKFNPCTSVLPSSMPIFTGEASFIYNMYKEEKQETKALSKQNGALEERIRQLETDIELFKKQSISDSHTDSFTEELSDSCP